jgi:3-deoxy-D-arabino-heptulosonate 7-phosphate (DAHP) synthase
MEFRFFAMVNSAAKKWLHSPKLLSLFGQSHPVALIAAPCSVESEEIVKWVL